MIKEEIQNLREGARPDQIHHVKSQKHPLADHIACEDSKEDSFVGSMKNV